jgi:hypothetical protein
MRKTISVLAAGVLMAGTAALVLWLQLRDERERGAALALHAEATQVVATAQAAAVAPAPQQSAAATDPGASLPAPTTAAAPAVATGAVPAPKPAPVAAAARAADPMSDMMRAMMLQMYPDLAAELDLTPAQAEQFMDVFARQQGDSGTQFMGLMGGSTVDAGQRQQLQRQMLDKERADQAELRRILGSKYQRWEEYQSTAEARLQVNELRTALAASGSPLTDPQASALVVAFAADASRSREEDQAWVATDAARNSPNLMRERMEREIEGQRRLVDLAAPHLNAAQLEQFRRKNDQDIAMVSSMLGMLGGGQ